MKYEQPRELDEEKINEILSDEKMDFECRISALLSSIYYSVNDALPGDRLIDEFKKANSKGKLSLINLVETYYDMRRTKYRIDEFITEMKNFSRKKSEKAGLIDDCIENLIQYKRMY